MHEVANKSSPPPPMKWIPPRLRHPRHTLSTASITARGASIHRKVTWVWSAFFQVEIPQLTSEMHSPTLPADGIWSEQALAENWHRNAVPDDVTATWMCAEIGAEHESCQGELGSIGSVGIWDISNISICISGLNIALKIEINLVMIYE